MHQGQIVFPVHAASDPVGFWRHYLHGFTAPTPLLASAGEPDAGEGEGDEVEVHLPAELLRTWSSFADAQRVAPTVVLCAAWAVFLSRCSREGDVMFGVAGPAERLPLRVASSPDVRLLDLVAQVQRALEATARYADVPAGHIGACSEVPFGSTLYDSAVGGPPDLPLVLDLHSSSCLRLTWQRRRFDRETAERVLKGVTVLLEGLLATPAAPLSEVPWLPAEDRHRVLNEFNATARPVPEGLLHDLFAEQAARTPDATALIAGDVVWTYRELDRRASALAHRLRDLGVGPDVAVPICVERSPDMIAGILGVLKAGGAYVPLDAAWPTSRLEYMLDNSGATVLLTQSNMASRFEGRAVRLVVLDRFDYDRCGGVDPHPTLTPANLAYIIYTSGSTGRPKGVAMVHGAAVNLMSWQNRVAGVGPEARTLQFVSLSFDVSVQEIFATLTSGGTLVLITETVRHDPVRLWRLLREARIERLVLPFTALAQLAAAAALSEDAPSDLQEVINCGERLQITPAIVAMFSRLPHCRLHNHYGPTEACVVMIVHELPPDPATWPALPVIGRPIDNTRAYILDDLLQPVPPGVAGELYIGGRCLARGYLGRPDLTADRFVPDPFAGETGARMYRTADLVRHRADGEIEFLGRLDNQVKIHGFRVELGEIEATLSHHPAVRACVVVVREDRTGERRLVAYVVPHGAAPTLAHIRDFLSRELASYMVPTALVLLERLPLTPGGKTDRQALPAPQGGRPPSAPPFAAPREGHERRLAAIWEEVLDVRPVGALDPFVDLGGKSVHLVAICARIREELGTEVDVTELFAHPTVRALAGRLNAPTPPTAPMSRVLERARRQRAILAGPAEALRSQPSAMSADAGAAPRSRVLPG